MIIGMVTPDPEEEEEKWEKVPNKKQDKREREKWDKVIKDRVKAMTMTYTGAGTSRNQNSKSTNIILGIAKLT